MIDERSMTLLTDYDGRNCAGWYATEKYDGCRGYWDGYTMWTRGGNAVNLPAHLRNQLPEGIALDGEIWAGRGNYTQARLATQYGGDHFTESIRFMVFDMPDEENDWRERLRRAEYMVAGQPFWRVVPIITELTDRFHARATADDIKAHGGEGIVIRSRSPRLYERGRSFHAMRIK